MLIYGDKFASDINYLKEKCPSFKEFVSEQQFNELCKIPFEGKRLKPPKRVYKELASNNKKEVIDPNEVADNGFYISSEENLK